MLIYRPDPDFSEVRFAEVKRMDTNDRLNEAQIRGLALLHYYMIVRQKFSTSLKKERMYQTVRLYGSFKKYFLYTT